MMCYYPMIFGCKNIVLFRQAIQKGILGTKKTQKKTFRDENSIFRDEKNIVDAFVPHFQNKKKGRADPAATPLKKYQNPTAAHYSTTTFTLRPSNRTRSQRSSLATSSDPIECVPFPFTNTTTCGCISPSAITTDPCVKVTSNSEGY